LTRLRPNQTQRKLLQDQVHNPDLWQETITHWLSHDWNPKNLPGMLELYARGGAIGCLICTRDAPPDALSALLGLERELDRGRPAASTPDPPQPADSPWPTRPKSSRS
jgi:hypothetical protein